MTQIGRNVRATREKIGWSQDQLAEAAGGSQTTVDKIERGETKRSRFLPYIARALGVPLDDLDPAAGAAPIQKPPADRDGAGLREYVLVNPDPELPLYAAESLADGSFVLGSRPLDKIPR